MAEPTPEQIAGFPDARRTADQVSTHYSGLKKRMSDWKDKIVLSDQLSDNQIVVRQPDGSERKSTVELAVENLYRDNLFDLKRSVPKQPAAVYVDPIPDNETGKKQANLRQAISATHRRKGRVDAMVPDLTMDIVGAGAMFVCVYPDYETKYPGFRQLDAMGCYPRFRRGKLLDLVYVEDVEIIDINDEYGLSLKDDQATGGKAKVVYWYTKQDIHVVVCAEGRQNKTNILVDYAENKIGRVPIAWSAEFDRKGEIDVSFLHIANVLGIQNTMMGMALHDAERNIHSPLIYNNVANMEMAGPDGQLIPENPDRDASVIAAAPPRLLPEFFGLMGSMDQTMRGSTTYSSQRQGIDLPSIVSAAGIAATSGPRAELVDYLQTIHFSKLYTEMYEIAYAVDEKYMDTKKRLLVPVGSKTEYQPSKDIDGEYEMRVVFGGGGLSPINQVVIEEGLVGNRLKSRASARRSIASIIDPDEEERKILMEDTDQLMFQTTIPQWPYAQQSKFRILIGQGMSMQQALEAVQSELEAAQAQGLQGQGVPGTPGPAPQPVGAGAANLAAQKGAPVFNPVGGLPPATSVSLKPILPPTG